LETFMTQSAQFSQLQDLSAAFERLVGSAAPSIVAIKSAHSRSSGFFWRPGLIVTAEEALPEEGDFTVTVPSGESLAARLVGRDHTTDIALLRVDRSDLRPIPLETKPMPVGALALAVGAEDGAPTAAMGVVSRSIGPWWSLRGGEINARIELDLRMRQSAEGGLAIDATGRAIGMTVFGPRRRVLVIPSATIERVAARLGKHGHIPRGYLGLGFQLVAIEGGERGVMVMNLEPQGPGAKAGVHQGDIIVTWNGEPIRHVRSLLRALGPDSVGQTVTLGLRRGGETKNVPLTIGERPTT
jgi:S1-C subfamily serine protease